MSAAGMREPPVRYAVALCPRGSAAVVSSREPGPAMGAGSLSGWRWPDGGPWWTTFEAALAAARRINAARGGRADARGQDAGSPAPDRAGAATEPDCEDFYPRAASARQAAPQSPARDDDRAEGCELDEDAVDPTDEAALLRLTAPARNRVLATIGRRWCPAGRHAAELERFSRHATHGYQSMCKDCKREAHHQANGAPPPATTEPAQEAAPAPSTAITAAAPVRVTDDPRRPACGCTVTIQCEEAMRLRAVMLLAQRRTQEERRAGGVGPGEPSTAKAAAAEAMAAYYGHRGALAPEWARRAAGIAAREAVSA